MYGMSGSRASKRWIASLTIASPSSLP
jgi:hypothetical protein